MPRSISQVKSPQVLYHLLLVVAIFPLPHPCAIGYLKSDRQIPTNSISSSFSGRYSTFSHFTSFSCCVSRCVSPGRRLQLLTVQAVLGSEAVGAGSSKRLPGETQRVPLDFPSQIVKSPQVLSHLLLVVAIQFFLILHHFPVASPVVSLRCVSPGRRLQLLTLHIVLSSEAVAASSSKRLPGETQCRDTTGAIAFPRSNR